MKINACSDKRASFLNSFKWILIIGLMMLVNACEQTTDSVIQSGDTGRGSADATLTIFAAASLTEAFTELGQQFEATTPGVTVSFNFAGSQQLAQQLTQGAPADLFASANAMQMNAAIDAGRVISNTPQIFARNRLVGIYPKDNPATINHLFDLASPGVRIILAAGEVPVGRYSLEFLDKAAQDPIFGADFKNHLLANVVSYEQNVRAVLTKIALGEGDAGIVYASDLVGSGVDRVGRIEIPDDLNRLAAYPIAVTADTAYPTQARAFVDFLLSAAGQEILARYGFTPVE